MNREGLVARLEVHGVEQPNLVEANDVPEIPTGNHIGVRNGCECDVKHVIAELQRQDAVCGIPIG